ncbi:efflux RND transporter periplasmic adaptor subunit [Ferrovibrio sp.]|uniref:efflux RND transporter periplasmic adaptor subunit n=1 Tax=Ferrovibrio sp. TaxID=1917215 RepID=UPI003D2CD33B
MAWRGIAAIVVLAGIGAGGYWYYTHHMHKPATKPEAAAAAPAKAAEVTRTSVAVAEANVADLPQMLEVIGTVYAYHTVMIRPHVDGEIMRIHFKAGDVVEANQLLFSLDARQLDAQIAQAEANLKRDQAQRDAAVEQEKRYAGLLRDDFVSREKYEDIKSKAQAAIDTVRADQAQIDALRVQRSYTQLRAPIAGRTGVMNLSPGALVRTGDQQPLVLINQIKPVKLQMALPQRQIGPLRAAIASNVATVHCSSYSGSGRLIQGQIELIDNAVDSSTGTVQVAAKFDNEDETFWPGMTTDCSLRIGIDRGVVLVPSVAVQTGPHGRYVYLVHGGETVRQQPVTVTRVDGPQALIAKGVEKGARVVVEGQSRLTDGQPIVIRQ